MRSIKYLIVHCSATEAGADIREETIEEWHSKRFKKYGGKHIGYHYLVYLDGTVVQTKKLSYMGQHVAGYNLNSVGICYIGGLRNGKAWDTRTPAQILSLGQLLKSLKVEFPEAEIRGHRDFPKVNKDCPCFNAVKEYNYL